MMRQLKGWRRVAWAWQYSRRDLDEALARPTSRAIVLAVLIATAVASLAIPLPWVAESVRLQRLKKSAWARCTWVAPRPDSRLDDERLRHLKAALGKIEEATGRPIVVSGYHQLIGREYNLFEKDRNDGLGVPVFGRTVAGDDELVASLPDLILGEPIPTPFNGLIVSPRLLRELGYDPGSPPATLVLRSQESGLAQDVPIRVTREELPEGDQFLMFERDDAQWRTSGAAPSEVRSGSIEGTSWSLDAKDYEDLAVKTKPRGFELSQISLNDKGQKAMCFQSTINPPLTWEQWMVELQYFESLVEEKFKKEFGGRVPWLAPKFRTGWEFDHVAFPSPPPRPRKSDASYTHATIYVSDLSDLKATAATARDERLVVYDSSRLLVDEIQTTARQSKWGVIVMAGGFCAAGFVALLLALYLRGQQKAAQIGMLRAMGADRRTLQTLATVEAFRLWLRGTVLGLATASLAATALAAGLGVSAAEFLDATGWWVASLVAFLGFSLFACIFGNRIATRGVRLASPAQALSQTP